MFKFTDLSNKNNEFKTEDYLLTPKQFYEKRRTTKNNYVFDLRINLNAQYEDYLAQLNCFSYNSSP